MSTQKKDLLTLFDYSTEQIREMIRLAAEIKARRHSNQYNKLLDKKTGVLIFEKPSLRTRISFETAIYELGGHVINLASEAVGVGTRESVEDVAKNLERIVHLIVFRTFGHGKLERLARSSSIPVINALTDSHHPCQALAFGLTMHEARPDTKLNVLFAGDGNNVCNSIMVLCAKLGHNFTFAGPKGYEPDADVVNRCLEVCAQSGGSVKVTNDLHSAAPDAEVIYTDVWTSMGQEAEAQERRKLFIDYQVNRALIETATRDVLVSHCLPALREEEITSDVLDSAHSVAFEEAENRLHIQKAVIVHLFS
ncbi:MAG: ornithine carbamoyltransferase [Chitinispirillales bacterium]|jgi:ornithine carbamoyltransferase|nr:ornithine carbamoyltransferase [Chitinispirillales bacterium]